MRRVITVFRTLLAVAAIVPGLGAGVLTLLWTRDRRLSLNRTLSLWGSLGPKAAGIELRVSGSEFLSVRPGVFIINHQSGIDPMLICALLKSDFRGVAKHELRRHPLFGPAFGFVGTVFLDRSDGVSSIRALEPAIKALGHGLAIAIAPEGTRSPDTNIGPFKTGAFRMAMAAGVPLIPIVIHDAGRVLPAGALLMRAGRVHVSVGSPIPIEYSDEQSLAEIVTRVEEIYQETLAAGPSAGREGAG